MKYFIGLEVQVEVADDDEAQELADELASRVHSDPRILDAWVGTVEADEIGNNEVIIDDIPF